MSEELERTHENETGLKETIGAVPKLLGGLALGTGAAVAGSFLLNNFSKITNLEAEFFGNLLSIFKDGSPPQFMALHPVVVPIIIVVVLIFCVISALTIEMQQSKLVTYAVQTYVHVTTCNWFTSVLGFLKCLFITVVYVIVTLVQVVVVFLMYITILINILAFVVLVFK